IADWVFSAVSPSTVVDVDAASELFALLAALAVVVEVDASLPSADGSEPCVPVFAVVSEESDGAEASVEPVASSDAVVVEGDVVEEGVLVGVVVLEEPAVESSSDPAAVSSADAVVGGASVVAVVCAVASPPVGPSSAA